jgi:hypothetical protein
LDARYPKRQEADKPVGGVVTRAVVVGDVVVVVAGLWTTRKACTYPWGFDAWRRSGDDWELIHGRSLTGTMSISCLFPDAGSTCQVPWDGGIVCDVHKHPTCPAGAEVLALHCAPRCVDVATCAVVAPLR